MEKELMLIEVVQTTVIKRGKKFVVEATNWPEAKILIEKELENQRYLNRDIMENEFDTHSMYRGIEPAEYEALTSIDQLDDDEHLVGITMKELTERLS